MAAYRRVYDSCHLQVDCQEPGSAPELYARQSSTGYLYLFLQQIEIMELGRKQGHHVMQQPRTRGRTADCYRNGDQCRPTSPCGLGTTLRFCAFMFTISFVPSVLWRCWLGGRKGIRPEKKLVVSAGMVICLERGADLHMAQPMPPPLTVSCFSIIHIGFTFLVPAHPGSPGQMAVKHVCVCV